MRVPWNLRSYFTVSDSRLPFLSSSTTRRATVEVLDPASTRNYWTLRVRVTLRLADYRQSVRLGAKPLETHGRNFFQLNTCSHSPYVTSSLTRGWVCRLQLLLAFASAFILRYESRRLMTIFCCLRFDTSPKLELRSPYLYPQEQGGSVTLPALGPLSVAFRTLRATVEVIRTLLHTLEGQSTTHWCINSKRT
jgi:hypothetical protein